MTETNNMEDLDKPVTHRQLNAAFDTAFKNYDAKLDAKFDAKFQAMETRLETMFRREFAMQMKAIEEQWGKYFGVIDDKYKDLPGRVKTLEQHCGLVPA